MSRESPPKDDELEISIIGPGRGECILVHLGNNEWCVVDSCIARNSKDPVAIEYLRSFNNNASIRIKLIVATHWHDDHIRGLASMVRGVPDAQFSCSIALKTEDFLTLVGSAAVVLPGKSGVDEFASIYDYLSKKPGSGIPKELAAPKFAIANRTLLSMSTPDRPFPVSITALSPSDGTLKKAYTAIANLIPKSGGPQQRITNLAPNSTSVTLWIRAGSKRVLLGADLEHSGVAGEGWMAVLDGHQDSTLAEVFKVAHHGSENADYPDIWTRLLVLNPFAVVTPFSSGTKLPRDSDLERLSAQTTNLFCTSRGAGKPPSRGPLVDKTARQSLLTRRIIDGLPGHVRLRWSATDEKTPPTVELFNGAFRVPTRAAASGS